MLEEELKTTVVKTELRFGLVHLLMCFSILI